LRFGFLRLHRQRGRFGHAEPSEQATSKLSRQRGPRTGFMPNGRDHGCRELLVYCGSINCSHGATLNADHMPDDTPIRPLGARMFCTRCGYRGADARPDWSPSITGAFSLMCE